MTTQRDCFAQDDVFHSQWTGALSLRPRTASATTQEGGSRKQQKKGNEYKLKHPTNENTNNP